MNIKNNKAILSIIPIIIYSLTIYLLYNKAKHEMEIQISNSEILVEDMKILEDKNGNLQAKISSFESDNVNLFLNLKTKDQEVIELQNQVSFYKKELKNKGSVTNFTTNTVIDTIFETSYSVDTITFTPIYESIVNLDNWITGSITVNNEYMKFKLNVKNKYSVVVGEEKQGLFKKRKPYVLVTNYNPYSEITSLRNYQVQLPKPKKFYIGPFIGVDITLKPIVGIGVGYSLIRF